MRHCGKSCAQLFGNRNLSVCCSGTVSNLANYSPDKFTERKIAMIKHIVMAAVAMATMSVAMQRAHRKLV